MTLSRTEEIRRVAIDVAISMNEEKFGSLAALRLRDAVYKSETT